MRPVVSFVKCQNLQPNVSCKISFKKAKYYCEFLQGVLLACILTSLQSNSLPQSNSQQELVIHVHLFSKEETGRSSPDQRHVWDAHTQGPAPGVALTVHVCVPGGRVWGGEDGGPVFLLSFAFLLALIRIFTMVMEGGLGER